MLGSQYAGFQLLTTVIVPLMTTAADQPLSAEAELAWLAYLAMGESKKAYFGFLQELDLKYGKNESPSIAENLKLEKLLETHSNQVAAFNEAMANVNDSSDREVLLGRLTGASAALGAH